MSTYTCSTEADPTKRPGPAQNSTADVIGRWTHRAYRMSHDEKTVITNREDGITVRQGEREVTYEMNLRAHTRREFMFSPDNKRVVFWAPLEDGKREKRVALLDVSTLSPGEPKMSIVYDPPEGATPFGLEWSPSGDALFVIERATVSGVTYTQIQRLSMPSGGEPRRIVRVAGVIDFFMPPVSRFENGSGPDRSPYEIIFGAREGLYLTDPMGRRQRRISKVPAVGLHNLEWNPDPKRSQVVLFFRFPTRGPDGRRFKGVYLLDLDKLGKNPEDDDAFIEHLYDGTDIHTLWFSPKGTYVTWASKTAVRFRKPEEPIDKTVELQIEDPDDGRLLEVRGVNWNGDESKLVYTAENRVMVLDVVRFMKEREAEERKKAAAAAAAAANGGVAPPATEPAEEEDEEADEHPNPYEIAVFPRGFVAEPRWVEDQVFLTVIEDIAEERAKVRATPSLGLPVFGEDREGTGTD